ncbi:hypothetical protein [Streptomyces sp. NPDC008121]|uniref:hypothetical protein n=1 Tax=Streptomyces sp. NPDC008121 TaxID=3364809 RepID=UPI0036E0D6F8
MTSESDLYRQSRRYNSAAAQFYRWFQLYERPRSPELVERQLQLFAGSFEIVPAVGDPVRTRDGYRKGITAYGTHDRHGHHVQQMTVQELGPDRLSLQADVHYQCRSATGLVTGTRISYEGELTGSADLEPLFTHLRITPQEHLVAGDFTDTYPANRALSLVHRWLFLVEDPAAGVHAFDELLAPDEQCSLAFGTALITNRRAMACWLQESSQRVVTSRHTVEAFRVTGARNGEYRISMEFDWHGTAAEDGALMSGRMYHQWTLLDTGERYCRVLEARATPIVPISRAVAG